MTKTTRQIARAPRRKANGKSRRPRSGGRASLIARLMRTAERQVREIESRLAGDMQEPAERENEARVLAVMVRVLRELAACDARALASGTMKDTAADDDDSVPRNLDDLRRELTRRIDHLCADGQDAGADGGARLS